MGIGLLQTHIYPTARKIPRAQRGLGVWGLAPIKCNRKASFHTPFSITAPSLAGPFFFAPAGEAQGCIT
jgi:hypothetical protein